MTNKISSAERADIALFITRLIIGGIFILAGWTKVSDMTATVSMFGSMGIDPFIAYLVSYGELIGGLLIVVGLFTHYASAFLGIVMLFATYYTFSGGFQAYSMPLAIFAGLVAIFGCGAGKYKMKW